MPTMRLATTQKTARQADLRNAIFPSRRAAEERGSRSLLTTFIVDGAAVIIGLGVLWAIVWMGQYFVHP